MVFALLFSIIGCSGEQVNRYRCTCDIYAYNMEGEEDIETQFSEVICETEENMETAFGPNGELENAQESCETDLRTKTDEYACDCTCKFLEPC